MTNTREQDRRIDELRQRLRALGYLDAGVDRFVLAPARQTRKPLAIALLASIRIGLLAALLLGPTAVVGLSGRIPGLITGTRDAAVLALYLGTFFGIGTAVAAFGASLVVWWAGKRAGSAITMRARGLSLGAGVVVTLLCLAYLTLWWQTAAGVLWSAPVWTVVALVIAAAISLLLGHAVTVTALAVIVAGTGMPADMPPLPGTSWRASLLAGVAAFAGAAALLLLSTSADSRAAGTVEPLTIVSSGVRVRVIAIDGFDARVFHELQASRQLPALAGALGQATVTLRLPAAESDRRDPARVWTTIATGQPVERHRVYGLQTRRVAGVQGTVALEEPSAVARAIGAGTDLLRLTRPAVASGTQRQEKTFWELAGDAGLRTAIVNWWATWPAPAEAGIILTDRATLRLERGGPLDAEIAPASLYERLQQQWPAIKVRAANLAARAMERSTGYGEFHNLLRRSAELDAIQLALASEVAGANTDLIAVYLPGLDIAQYALLSGTGGQAASPSALAQRLEAIRGYYAVLEHLLSQTLDSSGDELLFVVAAPGRVGGAATGLLGARGPAMATGVAIDSNVTDVAPTLLYALGIPLSRGLPGAPLVALFTDQFSGRFPPRYVTHYSRPSNRPAPRSGQPLDDEMLERLRSLGYVR